MKNAEVQRGSGIFCDQKAHDRYVIYFYTFKDVYFTKRHDSFTCRQIKGKFVAYRFLLIGFFSAMVRKFRLV